MKTKNQKPIDIDAHFKYKCPKSDCGYDHWLSLKESQTKKFKVVCDCGTVFQPKIIKKIKILYEAVVEKQSQIVEIHNQEAVVEQAKIPVDLQKKCNTILCGYGFTISECMELTEKAYSQNPIDDTGSLVKYIIKNLGELNEFH